MRLGGKVALITGAVSGMGQSEAVIFAKEGAKVIVADVLEAEGKKVADSLGGAGRFVTLDVTSETAWERAVATAVSTFGKLDVLVNNAGISGTFDPDTLSTSAWDRLMDVNAKGIFLGMKHAVPLMEKAGGGAIVNISSVSGFVDQNGIHIAYNASCSFWPPTRPRTSPVPSWWSTAAGWRCKSADGLREDADSRSDLRVRQRGIAEEEARPTRRARVVGRDGIDADARPSGPRDDRVEITRSDIVQPDQQVYPGVLPRDLDSVPEVLA